MLRCPEEEHLSCPKAGQREHQCQRQSPTCSLLRSPAGIQGARDYGGTTAGGGNGEVLQRTLVGSEGRGGGGPVGEGAPLISSQALFPLLVQRVTVQLVLGPPPFWHTHSSFPALLSSGRLGAW